MKRILMVLILIFCNCNGQKVGIDRSLFPPPGLAQKGWHPYPEKFDQEKAKKDMLLAVFAPLDMKDSKELSKNLQILSYLKVPVQFNNEAGVNEKMDLSVAVARYDAGKGFISSLVTTHGHRIVLQNGRTRLKEYYILKAIKSKYESNPLIMLIRDKGDERRRVSYELYRINPEQLVQIWAIDYDHYEFTLSNSYVKSYLDFSLVKKGIKNQIMVYRIRGRINTVPELEAKRDTKPEYMIYYYNWDGNTYVLDESKIEETGKLLNE